MKTKDFKKMSLEKQEDNYGGWAWLVAAIPLLVQSIFTAISSFKMIESSKGSVKYNGVDAKWDNDAEVKANSSSSSNRRSSGSGHSILYSM